LETHDAPTRDALKRRLLRRLATGAGTLMLATLAVSAPPATALPRPDSPPGMQRDEIRARLGLHSTGAPRPVPEDLAWGNWTNGGPWPGWNNWPNWNNWQDWPDWPNDWNNWSNWNNWGNI